LLLCSGPQMWRNKTRTTHSKKEKHCQECRSFWQLQPQFTHFILSFAVLFRLRAKSIWTRAQLSAFYLPQSFSRPASQPASHPLGSRTPSAVPNFKWQENGKSFAFSLPFRFSLFAQRKYKLHGAQLIKSRHAIIKARQKLKRRWHDARKRVNGSAGQLKWNSIRLKGKTVYFVRIRSHKSQLKCASLHTDMCALKKNARSIILVLW